MRTDLEKPYNFICELYTKSVVCNIGGLGQVSDNKLSVVTAIVDSLTGTKFNWFNWFIRNVQEAAMDFKFEEGSTINIIRKGKLRLIGKLSYALEQLFPGSEWTGTLEYKKSSVFHDLVKVGRPLIDRGILQKNVRPTVPAAERKKKGTKRAASPVKRAAPKKVKRVATPEPSVEVESPLEDTIPETTEDEDARAPAGDEVNQPQPEASTIVPSQPQATKIPQPKIEPTPQTQAPETQFQP